MANYSTSEFKNGLKVMLEGDPCSIVMNELVKPGKGQAFNRVKLRNLRTGRVWERTFKSGESVEAADVLDVDLQYLYNDGDFWHFMDNDNFEQYGKGRKRKEDGSEKSFESSSTPSVGKILESFENCQGSIEDYFGFPITDLE